MTRPRMLAALAPAAASASTVHYDAGGVLRVTAAAGEANLLSVQESYVAGLVQLYDSGVPVNDLPAECIDDRDWHAVSCPAPAGVAVELGDGDDTLFVSWGVTVPVAADGGPGADRLESSEGPATFAGGPGDDLLRGFEGDDALDGGDGNDTVEGGAGRDRVVGGPGHDLLEPDGYEPAAADVVDGGPGVDRIEGDWDDADPNSPAEPITVTLAGRADDGRPGEGDDVRRVETIALAAGARIVGTAADESLSSRQTLDRVRLAGRGGRDLLKAGDGTDRVNGGAGDDMLDGGFGDDRITGGPGRDTVWADRAGGDCGPVWCRLPWGNDVVDVRDGEVDSVTCGAGRDRVRADSVDVIAGDCEEVVRISRAAVR